MHKLFAVTLTTLLTASVTATSEAASFDCEKAGAVYEKTICADRVLNDKDVSMALLYNIDRRFMGMGARGALMDDQAEWLKRRNACGAKGDCLNALYDQRISVLRKFIDERVVTQGPF
jgi:uncharacterized protein